MKAYEWLTEMVTKSEIRVFLFNIILGIVIWVLLPHVYDSLGIVPFIITILLWGSIIFISSDIYLQRADLENWVCVRLQSEWEYVEKPISILSFHPIFVLLFAATRFMVPIIVIGLAISLALVFVYVLWIGCDDDISEFGENINNYTSIILVFVFMAQAWIFYQQYHHMKQPLFKTPLLWALSKSNSDTDCCILLKNDGTAPVFNISYHILKVSVNDRWGYKTIKSEEISKDLLPRLDSGSEKEIFEKPTEDFKEPTEDSKEMGLAVDISAKTLDGYGTRLFFYKAIRDIDFRLVGVIRT